MGILRRCARAAYGGAEYAVDYYVETRKFPRDVEMETFDVLPQAVYNSMANHTRHEFTNSRAICATNTIRKKIPNKMFNTPKIYFFIS